LLDPGHHHRHCSNETATKLLGLSTARAPIAISVTQKLTIYRLTWALGTMIGPLIGMCLDKIVHSTLIKLIRWCSIIFMSLVLVAEPSLLWSRPGHDTTSRKSGSPNRETPCHHSTRARGLDWCYVIHQRPYEFPRRSLFWRHQLPLAVVSNTVAVDSGSCNDRHIPCLGG